MGHYHSTLWVVGGVYQTSGFTEPPAPCGEDQELKRPAAAGHSTGGIDMSANERQEGGDHYQTGDKPQHWDLAIMYQWDPFQYQITKYVMRWKDKHDTPEKRLVDLKKARHFLDKYIENFDAYDSGINSAKEPAPDPLEAWLRNEPVPPFPDLYPQQAEIISITVPLCDGAAVLRPVEMMAHLDQHTNGDWGCEGWYGDMTQLYRCRHCRSLVRSSSIAEADDFHVCVGPGPSYVNQDQQG